MNTNLKKDEKYDVIRENLELVIVRSWGGGGAVIEDSLNVISFYLIRLWEKKKQ